MDSISSFPPQWSDAPWFHLVDKKVLWMTVILIGVQWEVLMKACKEEQRLRKDAKGN